MYSGSVFRLPVVSRFYAQTVAQRERKSQFSAIATSEAQALTPALTSRSSTRGCLQPGLLIASVWPCHLGTPRSSSFICLSFSDMFLSVSVLFVHVR